MRETEHVEGSGIKAADVPMEQRDIPPLDITLTNHVDAQIKLRISSSSLHARRGRDLPVTGYQLVPASSYLYTDNPKVIPPFICLFRVRRSGKSVKQALVAVSKQYGISEELDDNLLEAIKKILVWSQYYKAILHQLK